MDAGGSHAPQESHGAVFASDVQITTLSGQTMQLRDIMDHIWDETSIRGVKCHIGRAISCSMYIIKLFSGVEELCNATWLSALGPRGDCLILTMVLSPHYDEASCTELLRCLRRDQVTTEAVDDLLWQHADPNSRGADGGTPLSLASARGHLALVRLLSGAGAELNCVSISGAGTSAVSIAARLGHLQVVRFLCNAGADKNQADRGGVTALNEACEEGHLEVVRFLCDAGGNKDQAETHGQTPLYVASCKGHVAVVHFLCRAGANTDLRTEYGFGPLHVASDPLVACLLRNAGAESVLRRGVKRRRPVQCAHCREKKRLQAFGPEFLARWERVEQREEGSAVCRDCLYRSSSEEEDTALPIAAEFGMQEFTGWAYLPVGVRNAETEFWNQSLYKCSGCNSELHPHKFDTTELTAWERTSMLHEAKCGNCDSDRQKRTKARTCKSCGLKKDWHAFSPGQETRIVSHRWRCKDCDCPACSSCGAIPMEPQPLPYRLEPMCSECAFPPCSCGFPRPRRSEYRVSLKPTWRCAVCRRTHGGTASRRSPDRSRITRSLGT